MIGEADVTYSSCVQNQRDIWLSRPEIISNQTIKYSGLLEWVSSDLLVEFGGEFGVEARQEGLNIKLNANLRFPVSLSPKHFNKSK